jgi:hypothetical protein
MKNKISGEFYKFPIQDGFVYVNMKKITLFFQDTFDPYSTQLRLDNRNSIVVHLHIDKFLELIKEEQEV